MNWFKRGIKCLLIALPLLYATVLMADETEIYFTGSTDKVRPNILFLIDASGSMSTPVPGDPLDRSRMQVMQEAFKQTMTELPSNLNIGLTHYANEANIGDYYWGSNKGINFPVTPPDDKVQPMLAPYQNNDNLPNPSSGSQKVRSFLSEVVQGWQAQGGTPIVDALYEAARYYRGDSVGWGMASPEESNASHMLTYSGSVGCTAYDTVECNDSLGLCNETKIAGSCHEIFINECCVKLPNGECENNDNSCGHAETLCEHQVCKTWSAGPTYRSPIKNRCQPNFIVLMSDGKPEYPYRPYSPYNDVNGTVYYPPSVTSPSDDPAYNRDSLASEAATYTSQVKVSTKIPDYIHSSCADAPSTYKSGKCGPELTHWLASTDQNTTFEGDQTVDTYAIGFALEDQDSTNYLKSLVTKNDGFFPASNVEDLTNAFQEIVQRIKKTAYSFSSPSYMVNEASLLSHSDEVYIPMFDNALQARWNGNIKKFKRASDGKLVDKNNQPALNDKGQLLATAYDFWGTEPSGPEVDKGGAASRLPAPDSRKLYTDLLYTGNSANLTNSSNKLHESNTALTSALLGDASLSAEQRTTLLKFARGLNDNGQARNFMGDMLNTKPQIVTYLKDTESGFDKDKSYIFAATNEGYLHAIDTETGIEQWAFMPQSLLKNIPVFYENPSTTEHVYGIDGAITIWQDDVNNDGKFRPSTDSGGDRLYLFFGLRRGGAEYYGLDITDISSPKVIWHISNQQSAFSSLGQTWSKPVLATLRVAATDSEHPNSLPSVLKPVLVFGGGYDPVKDEANTAVRQADSKGKDVFIIDALTGAKIWKLSDTNTGSLLHDSVPGDIRVMDMDNNGALDRLYFADTGGNVWRVDMDVDVTDEDGSTLYDYSKAKLSKFAQLAGNGAANKRMFFYEPDVALMKHNGKMLLTLAIGSGYRAHPLDDKITDKFYVLVDRNPYDAPDSEIFPITEDEDTLPSIDNTQKIDPSNINKSILNDTSLHGWYYDLPNTSEKVLAPAVTFMNKVVFTTFAPVNEAGATPSNPDPCDSEAATTARAYVVDLFNGAAVADLDRKASTGTNGKDRFIVAGVNEILDAAQVVFQAPKASNGSACTASDCHQWVEIRVGKLDLPLMDSTNSTNTSISGSTDVSQLIQRSFWLDCDTYPDPTENVLCKP